MAHRDLTQRFRERRQGRQQRQLRFQLRRLTANPPPVLALFQSKQQHKTRAMEKALLQEAIACDRLELGETLRKPEWTHFADEANEAIRLLHVKLEYLQLLHTRRLMIRFDDSEAEQEHEIAQLTGEITVLFQNADRSLKQITRPFIGGVPCLSPTDRLVRVNTQRAIASRLQTITTAFRTRQREYFERLQVQKFGSDAFEQHGDDTSDASERYRTRAFDLALETQRSFIASRDDEIQRIAKSVAMLATVFKEVADMVIDQGTLVDRIDYNMEQVVSRMQSGLHELQRADKYERNTRPERCIFVLVALIFLCLALLILKHA